MKHDAIVLLGYSGVGKDTCYRELRRRSPDTYVNAKFSALHKLITAKVFDLDVSDLESKSLRCEPVNEWYGLSPLDLLTVLYRGITPRMQRAYGLHLLAVVGDKLPVFTDVRSYNELSFVRHHYETPLFIWLTSDNVHEGENDGLVSSVAHVAKAHVLCRDGQTVEETVDSILEIANEN